jgi:hypothetical protein
MKDNIIDQIIEIEWNMFSGVSNIGGRASCQEDPETFKIMRSSQFAAWATDVLTSYLDDLISAKKEGRNLMTEKYARMMEYTSPLEWANLAHLLPNVNKKNLNFINTIVKYILEWEYELSKNFPYIRAKGRPTFSSSDNPGVTSLESYLRGELATYSLKTLVLYHNNVLQQRLNDINASEITLLHMVKAYGYKSLEEANERLKSKFS